MTNHDKQIDALIEAGNKIINRKNAFKFGQTAINSREAIKAMRDENKRLRERVDFLNKEVVRLSSNANPYLQSLKGQNDD
jgi:archaellum component FlaC